MNKTSPNLLLADDDLDDCFLFQEALEEHNISVKLITINDGVQLMKLLSANETQLPDGLFLDLNMPNKSSVQCLSEIKVIDKLKNLPIIIYSTSLDTDVVNLLYEKEANHDIKKPGGFAEFKQVIFKAVTLKSQSNPM